MRVQTVLVPIVWFMRTYEERAVTSERLSSRLLALLVGEEVTKDLEDAYVATR